MLSHWYDMQWFLIECVLFFLIMTQLHYTGKKDTNDYLNILLQTDIVLLMARLECC